MAGRAAWLLLAAAVLAGCAGGQHKATGPDPATTGAVDVLVVDDAIRPLAGANATLLHDGAAAASNATGADGLAHFRGLAPGAYVLHVARKGYLDAQQNLDVAAGAAAPVAKVQLAVQAGGLAFYQEFKIDGYLECSASEGNWCGIANYYPCAAEKLAGQQCSANLTDDRSLISIDKPFTDLQRVPDWLQLEMVWQSTQAVSPYLTVRIDLDTGPNSASIDNRTPNLIGPSPLLLTYPPAWMKAWGLGLNHSMTIETFHGGPAPVCDADPSGQGLCILAGVGVQQRFTDYVHAFYGYLPPDGWRFSTDGTVPQPPS